MVRELAATTTRRTRYISTLMPYMVFLRPTLIGCPSFLLCWCTACTRSQVQVCYNSTGNSCWAHLRDSFVSSLYLLKTIAKHLLLSSNLWTPLTVWFQAFPPRFISMVPANATTHVQFHATPHTEALGAVIYTPISHQIALSQAYAAAQPRKVIDCAI